MSESATEAVAAQWGPVVIAVAPMINRDDLYVASNEVWDRYETVAKATAEKANQWRDAEDGPMEIQDALWDEFRELCREREILYAWYTVIKAAVQFGLTGFQSHYLEDVCEIPLPEEASRMVYGLNPETLRKSC